MLFPRITKVPPKRNPKPRFVPRVWGFFLSESLGKEKARPPRTRLSPLANASSLKSVARFVRTLDRQAWQFSGGYAQSMRRVNLLAFSTVPAKKPS